MQGQPVLNLHAGVLASLPLLLTACGALAQATTSVARQDQQPVALSVYPARAGECRGVAIISPGAGGSEKGYRYLGEAMSSLNYLAVVVGHEESGPAALRARVQGRTLREGLASLVTDPQAHRGRFQDIAAARGWASARCAGPGTVLIGHSMGAATAMLAAGALNHLGLTADDSFDLYVAISPQGSGSIFAPNAWSDIKKPVLTLTGTLDTALEGSSWRVRTEPYQGMRAGCKSLAVIKGATHLNFAGQGFSSNVEALSSQIIAAFIHGVQRGDCAAAPSIAGVEIWSK